MSVREQVKTPLRWGVSQALPRAAMSATGRRGDLQGRLVTASRERDPEVVWPVVDEIRAAGPLVRSKFVWVTADHDVSKTVLTSPDFRSGMPGGVGWVSQLAEWSAPKAIHPVRPPSLLVTEPPDHTRYRKLVMGVFTARAVTKLRARTESIAAELLDRIPARRPVDLIEAYCALLPVTVITEVLGVPPKDRPLVLRLGAAAAGSLDLGLTWREFRSIDKALIEFDAWLGGHLEHLRRNPGDNLMSQMVQASDEHGTLSEKELKSTAGLVLVAGFETTVNLLGNGLKLLHDNPTQREALLRGEVPWLGAVEEALRLDGPVLLTGRVAVRDTVLAGEKIAAGMPVVTVLGGANRDPEVFPDPTRFDVARENARDHLSFSAGRHHCLGAALARMEGEVGLQAITERFPELLMLPGARRRSTRILRGYANLPALPLP